VLLLAVGSREMLWTILWIDLLRWRTRIDTHTHFGLALSRKEREDIGPENQRVDVLTRWMFRVDVQSERRDDATTCIQLPPPFRQLSMST
jgi:hypothetical protein